MPRHYPICLWCKHYDTEKSHDEKYCSAFPDGIPVEIWGDEYGPRFDHHLPHPADKGIQFEKADFTIIQKRNLFYGRLDSEDVSDMVFESSAKMIRLSHEGRIRIEQNPPRTHSIVPLDLREAQALRDRCREWGFDLSLRDNQIEISGELYERIHSNLPAYAKWLEGHFVNAKTPKEGAIVFGKIIDALIREDYP
jgi:hypothetical protein